MSFLIPGICFRNSRHLLPIFRVFFERMPGLSGVNSGRFGSKCRGIWRYDNPFVPALIHYDAKQDKGMFS